MATPENSIPLWAVWGKAVQGAAHSRNQKVCQDDIKWREEAPESRRVILAVADGHGSSQSPYSNTGASLAVGCACQVLDDFYHEAIQPTAPRGLNRIKQTAERLIPRVLISRWREAVSKDFSARFPTTQPPVEWLLWQLYGTTLLSVLVTEYLVLCTQIGDGDILMVTEEGEVSWLIPKDERLIGVETTSLASPRSESDFRTALYTFSDSAPLPALLMLSTDGYFNSFELVEGFHQAARDYLNYLRQHGPVYVQEHLPSWLGETSNRGSGDDITVGLIWLGDLVPATDTQVADGQGNYAQVEDLDAQPLDNQVTDN